MRQRSHKPGRKPQILTGPPQIVKARVVAAGIKLGDLAAAARISQSNLSMHISGIRKNRKARLVIWDAYRRLAGEDISFDDFWKDCA